MLDTIVSFVEKSVPREEQANIIIHNWKSKVEDLLSSNGMTEIGKWWPITQREDRPRPTAPQIQTQSLATTQQVIRESIPSVVRAGWTQAQKTRAEVSS